MVPDCVAKSLMEGMTNTAKDPAYMERVVKSAVGSMYIGMPFILLTSWPVFNIAVV